MYEGEWHNLGTVEQLEKLNAPPASIVPGAKGAR